MNCNAKVSIDNFSTPNKSSYIVYTAQGMYFSIKIVNKFITQWGSTYPITVYYSVSGIFPLFILGQTQCTIITH